jgi:hypothetical protein
MTTENIELIVSGKDDNATGVLKDVQRESGGLGKILKGGLVIGAAAAVVGVGALGAVLKSSVGDAMEAEEATAQLNATIKSTKGVAGMTAKAVQDQALAFSKLTRFEDDEIAANSAVMLTFTNIGKDIFPRATGATLDLATKFKMELQPATVMVGKALNDPIKGVTALGKAGVTFSETQKAMIKALVETGDVANAQNIILKELETQVGGSAAAAGKTAAGQMDIFKNSIGNVKEEIGGALIPVIQKLMTWVGPKLVAGFQAFSDWIKGGIVDIEQLAGKLGKAKDIIGGMITDVQAGKKIDWQDLMNLAGLFTNSLDIQRKFATIATDIQTGIGQIKAAFESGGIGDAFAEIWRMMGDWWTTDAIPFATELGGKISAWWTGTFLPALKTIPWASIGTAMQTAWNTLSTFWQTEAIPFATQVANSIGTWFTDQVFPILKTQAPIWGAKLTEVLKSMITISGFKLGDDANLAYTLGAGFVKLLISSLKALSVGPQLLFDALKKAFEGGISGASFGDIFGDIFGGIGDFLMGALDAMLTALLGDATAAIGAWWAKIWATLTSNPFNNSGGGGGGSGGGGGGSNSNNRAMDGGMTPITVHVYAAGGSPDAVRRAANMGTLEALRARGYR